MASTPRSGSSLLAAGLVATGVAGRPEEYFTPDHIGASKQDLKLPGDCSWRDYLATVMAFAATENGVRGDPGAAIEFLFPAAVFVNIVRADRRAQAISLFRAGATDEWFHVPARRARAAIGASTSPGPRPPGARSISPPWHRRTSRSSR
ncbi:hypothetical protein H7I01_01410 [Mycobacterium palustre]|nr:hypothetical protein [Mycobacterium palustre]